MPAAILILGLDRARKREGKGLSENTNDNAISYISCRLLLLLLHPCEIPPGLPNAGGCSQSTRLGFGLCRAAGNQAQPSGGTAQTALRDRDSPGSSRCSGLNAQGCQPWGHLPEYGNSFQICRSLGSSGALTPGPG